jgi:hypothetical protein
MAMMRQMPLISMESAPQWRLEVMKMFEKNIKE